MAAAAYILASPMLCPSCQTPLKPDAGKCPSCQLSYPRNSSLLSELPPLTPGIADTTGLLDVPTKASLEKRLLAIQRRFPQLVPQIVVETFSKQYPLSLHAFWIFNAENFIANSARGKENHTLLIALDPVRNEAAIVPGYGLEPVLPPEALDQLLELAAPAWDQHHWDDGLIKLLDGLDSLLESVALSEELDAVRSNS